MPDCETSFIRCSFARVALGCSLALMTGDLARAERHLATLQRACAGGCEELADLRREIDRYKGNGNRFVAAP